MHAEFKNDKMEPHSTMTQNVRTPSIGRLFDEFYPHYYANVAPEDFAARQHAYKTAAAKAHWKIAQQRDLGTPVIQVYNPDKARDGWHAYCTVINVVTDDMPFLVDSIRMEVNRQGYAVNIIVHPIYRVARNRQGKIRAVAPNYEHDAAGTPEAFIHVEIERQPDIESLQALEKGVSQVLQDVCNAVNDWRKMRDCLQATIDAFDQQSLPLSLEEVNEARAFLQWLDNNHFTFLGCRDYEFVKQGGEERLQVVPGSGLGVLRDPERRTLSLGFASMPAEIRERIKAPELLVISKSTARSSVHRPGHMDYISVKRFDTQGRVIGERRFLGLYTSTAYRRSPRDIPYLRDKISRVFQRSKLDPVSHSGKSLLHILETYPRDELFQISEDDLYEIARGIMHLGESQRTKLFVRNDRFLRYVTCMVYVPRDRYDTDLRIKILDILREAFATQDVVFNVRLTEDAMARIEFIAMTQPDKFPLYDAGVIEQRIIAASYSWEDRFKHVLLQTQGEELGASLFKTYRDIFPLAYKADFDVQMGVDDIAEMVLLQRKGGLNMRVCDPGPNQVGTFRFRLYTYNAIAPSDALPILENMGVKVLDEVPYPIRWQASQTVWIHDYGLSFAESKKSITDLIKQNFEDVFAQVWRNQVENDGLNQLVLKAGLNGREVVILRSYCKYLLQTRQTYSQAYMETTLAAHPAITKMLVELFAVRFDPDFPKDRVKSERALQNKLAKALDAVQSLDQDNILRNYVAIIDATLRSNYYQVISIENTMGAKPYVSFKLDSSRVPELPDPRPLFEIFVYSPQVEGVHLRGGKVARGGLRWSDRREDFRTEVLGLVKAQMVKNAVIVPVGAKGGFVVKQAPADGREALMQEVRNCYTDFISGLLDITDNIVDGKVVPPVRVVRYDEDDPYLVVAADKGTATFSDLANSIAERYDFWLGDAFASGGSNGYDHKKMGITAKGAWESVKLLFRELGKDIQTTNFTAVGIGDMAGDVFGNGMLLSKHTQLLAAFNHMHIFIDPNPDAAKCYKERQRLFKLPRSTWEDYDKKLISRGGGVYLRSAKSIAISPQAQRALGIKEKALSPNKLISAILKAPVDLLWNGGIGTYVKASYEQHGDAGDRSNDAVRVNADELHCKVIGEGGNLGLTQRARIEFARHGGRLDTDFIHNSGGVDCSDHEVNIKILLNGLKAGGQLTEAQRVQLLSDMTGEVAEFVLLDNYWQGQAISLMEIQAARQLDEHARLMRNLEHQGLLKRKIELLPNDEELQERKAANEGLSRPELAVLMAYAKMDLFPKLVESDLWSDAYFAAELQRYFPLILRKRYAEQMQQHRLRTEILATFILNRMVNRMGSSFAFVIQEETGASYAEITRAYTIAWETFNLRRLWADIVALDNNLPGRAQTEMMLEAVKLIQRASKWLLQHRRRALGIVDAIAAYGKGAQVLAKMLPSMFEKSEDENIQLALQHYLQNGVDKTLASHVVAMDAYYSTFDIVDIANKLELELETVTETYFAISAYLSCYWLRVQISKLAVDNHWQQRANAAMIDDLYRLLRNLTGEVLWFNQQNQTAAKKAAERISHWHAANRNAVDRYLSMINDLKLLEHQDYAILSVSLREVQNMLQASLA